MSINVKGQAKAPTALSRWGLRNCMTDLRFRSGDRLKSDYVECRFETRLIQPLSHLSGRDATSACGYFTRSDGPLGRLPYPSGLSDFLCLRYRPSPPCARIGMARHIVRVPNSRGDLVRVPKTLTA